jgi:thioredoxin 1
VKPCSFLAVIAEEASGNPVPTNKHKGLTMKPTIEINEANFESEVLRSNQPVLVDFWAEWCGPCKMIAPLLDEIATEQAGRVKVAKVNVDVNPVLAARFGIQSIPTLLYFAGGELRDQTIGVTGKRAIVAKLEQLALAA